MQFLMDLDIHPSSSPELVLWTLILSICLLSGMIISVVTIVFLSLKGIHINDRMLMGIQLSSGAGSFKHCPVLRYWSSSII